MNEDWVDDHILAAGPDGATALLCASGRSYRQLRAAVTEWTARLAGHGVGARSTVALRLAPSFTYLELLLAVWRRGAQLQLIDHRTAPAEQATLLASLRPQLLITDAGRPAVQAAFAEDAEVVMQTRPDGLPRQSDHDLVQTSSGSTGLPKLVGRTAASLFDELHRFDAIEGSVQPDDCVLLLNSISHTFGLVGGILHTLRRGAALAFADRPIGRDIMTRLEASRATVVFGVPFHFEMMAATPLTRKAGAVRAAVSGGERMPQRVGAAFADRFGVPLGEAYGMTEVGIIAADYLAQYPGTVGRLTAGTLARIADDQLEVWTGVPPYLDGSTGNRFTEGWLSTHDTATIDGRGAVTIGPRIDSVATIGGLKVDLTEVEQVLKEHPAVRAAVVVMGAVLEAYLEPTEDVAAAEVTTWCRSRLAGYKIPKAMVVLPVLPRTSTGKLKRDRAALVAAADQR